MNAAFTPGPWVWVEGSDAINSRWNNLDWTVASVGNHRLGWHEDRNSEGREAGANARLIANAPCLLKRLQAAINALDRLTHRVDGTGFSESDDFTNALDELDLGNAAIAKATGTAA